MRDKEAPSHVSGLDGFARTILFGATLEDKLVSPPFTAVPDARPPAVPALTEVPRFPGRPPRLARLGKARFPPLAALNGASGRGEVLHFFANHELLALELMALVLLRFPGAPPAFREGLARTMAEEQNHLRLYLERMQELGVGFGDLPLSDYFWSAMSGVTSPLDFVVRMSLTFEQANLDFSRYFRDAVARTDDDKTAAVLDRVYREEIGHVRHGLLWFNRWREHPEKESEWQAYVRLLPPPLTARRAKGFEFAAEARREAGFSEEYITELRLCGGSKGRPPTLWLFNAHCDAEIARGTPGFTPTAGSRRMARDLEATPLFLAQEEDSVLVSTRPGSDWLASLEAAGIHAPEFLIQVRDERLSGVQPWGWSPDMLERLRPLAPRLSGESSRWSRALLESGDLSPTGLGRVFSKSWSATFLAHWLKAHPETAPLFGDDSTAGAAFGDEAAARARIEEILSGGRAVALKAPYGTAGTAVKQLRQLSELAGPAGGWLRNTLAGQGALVIEPWLEKTCDLSIQLVVEDDRTRLLETRRFVTGGRHEYRGTYLGRKLTGFDAEHLRFLHSVLESWHRLVRDLAEALRAEGYRGPAGVDALVWREKDGTLRLKPLVELNPRWTMGRVALALEAHLAPSVAALWAFLPVRELKARGHADAPAFARALAAKHPIELANQRLCSGVVFTNDPGRAEEVLTVLTTLPNPEIESVLGG